MLQASVQQFANTAVTDLFPTGNVASAGAGETTTITPFVDDGGNTTTSLVNPTTDSSGGTYSVKIEALADGFRQATITVSGLNTTPHTATIRMRANSANGGVFNWSNVSSTNYDVNTTERTDEVWYVRTVTFTPTTGTVGIKFYADSLGGGFDAGQYMEVSEIVITEN